MRATVALCLTAGAACHHSPPGGATLTGDGGARAVLAGLRLPVAIVGEPVARMTLRDRMAYYAVPAVSITVVRDNRIAWHAAVGVRRAGSTDSITPATLMQAASISKPLVALATLRLVESGALAIEDPANAHLRSWRIPENELTARSPVRIGQLLSHTAGTTNGAVGIYAPGAPLPTLLQALDGIAPSTRPPVRVDVEPGTTYRYSGGGYSILQQLLIDVTATPFPALMDSLVLRPAGMTSSCYCQPLPPSRAPDAAAGHDDKGQPIAGDWWTLPEMAAGGLWATADDLARFTIAVNRSWRGEQGTLLRTATARRMLAPGPGGWGLGFEVDTAGGALHYSHTGSNNGYRAVMLSYPERGDGIVVLTNGDNGGALRDEIVRSAAEEYGWPADRQAMRSVDAGANPALGEFAGRYQYMRGFASTMEVSGDSLVARLNAGAPSRLYSEGRDVFFSIAGTTYRFERDSSGAVTSVIAIFADGSRLSGKRL